MVFKRMMIHNEIVQIIAPDGTNIKQLEQEIIEETAGITTFDELSDALTDIVIDWGGYWQWIGYDE